MYRIAVVEDNKEYSGLIAEFIGKFMAEKKYQYKTYAFFDGMEFLLNIRNDFDIVLMDIEMPLLDGMEASRRLRQSGSNAKLIFITNMAQYAINGYEVEAIGYLVKPITYFGLSEVLKKAIGSINRHKDENVKIIINAKNNVAVIPASIIYYVEVQAHDLFFHTETGVMSCHKTLKEVREILEPANFALCNNCFLVNLKYVTEIGADYVAVNGEKVAVSRRRKKELWDKFMDYSR